MSVRFPCPCCRNLTLSAEPPGTFDICPVCRWEDDNVQFRDPDYRGGANVMSLNEARRNFREMGAKDSQSIDRVRPRNPDEAP